MYAIFGGADFGAGCGACRGEASGAAAAGADRLGDRAGLGGQPRVADLRARRALDRVLRRVRGEFSTLFIPLSLAALGIVLRGSGFAFQQDARALGAERWRRRSSGSPRCSPRSSWERSSARSRRPGAGRQRCRRRRDELAQSAVAGDRRALRGDRRLPRGGVPGQRRPARRARDLERYFARARSSPRSSPGRWRPRARRPPPRSPVRLRPAHERPCRSSSSRRLRDRGARAAPPGRARGAAPSRGRRSRRRDLGLGRRAVPLPPARSS